MTSWGYGANRVSAFMQGLVKPAAETHRDGDPTVNKYRSSGVHASARWVSFTACFEVPCAALTSAAFGVPAVKRKTVSAWAKSRHEQQVTGKWVLTCTEKWTKHHRHHTRWVGDEKINLPPAARGRCFQPAEDD
jgi:hypothetical protein